MKFYLEKKGYGKFQNIIVRPVSTSSKKYKELINSNAKIFDSKEKARRYALSLNGKN